MMSSQPSPFAPASDAAADLREPGLHVGIIMDGNGRWAQARRLPRTAGHRMGAEAVNRVVEAAVSSGIGTLSLYAFSQDNWQRPRAEVSALMRLFERYLRREAARCHEHGVRINVIGRRERFAPGLLRAIEAAERETATAQRMLLRIAVDHSGRATLERAAAILGRGGAKSLREAWDRSLHSVAAPDLDLVIRTSGEQRISDFLLLECAYAELYFTDRLWPEFGAADLAAALNAYRERQRRFGRSTALDAEAGESRLRQEI